MTIDPVAFRAGEERDHVGYVAGLREPPAGLHLLLTLPDGTEHAVLRRAGEAGVALAGLSRLRHPLAGTDAPGEGIVVNFGAPAEHAFTAAVEALCGVLRDSGLESGRDRG